MRSTATTKLIHSYEPDESGAAPTKVSVDTVAPNSTSNLRLPNFDYGDAVAARIAGRRNALKATEAEQDALLLERQLLLDKHFAGTISPKETNRLAYVRWQLDRIEDARYGDAVDFLESAVERYERLSKDMAELTEQLTKAIKEKKR
jgi:hypothetical protein